MQQIKIFKGVDTEIPEIERQINRWMRKSGAKVLSIQSSMAPQPSTGGPMNSFAGSDIMLVLHYEIEAPTS